MPKGIKKPQNKNRKQIERLDTFQSSDDNTSKDSENFDKTERTFLKNPNKFIYLDVPDENYMKEFQEKIGVYISNTKSRTQQILE